MYLQYIPVNQPFGDLSPSGLAMRCPSPRRGLLATDFEQVLTFGTASD